MLYGVVVTALALIGVARIWKENHGAKGINLAIILVRDQMPYFIW